MFSGIVTGDIQSLIETNNRLASASERQESENSIQKQLTAFERLLQHAMSRFSKETLYYILRHVTRWAEEDEKARAVPSATKVSFKLRSVDQLRDILVRMKAELKPATPEDDNVFKQCDLFLNDLLYLKDLKKYFDDEIHKALLKYHFDPSIGSQKIPESGKTDKQDDDDSGTGPSHSKTENDKHRNNIRNGNTKRQDKSKERDDKQKAEIRYKQTIHELNTIVKKWEGLLSDYTLDLNDFDPDSYHELMQFSNYSRFEPILRMVPDIFAKCYKCIDLAKLWLKESNIVLQVEEKPKETPIPESDTQTENRSVVTTEENRKEFVKQVKNIQFQISNMEQSITEDEMLLMKYNREMADLDKREGRYSAMSSDVERIDSDISNVALGYHKSKSEQSAIAVKLKRCRKGSSDYEELKSHLKRLDSDVAEMHWKMKLLEFERTTIQEDFMVEGEVRPSFIRFSGDTKEKIGDLERVLQAKKEEKVKLEKQLALLKTNTDRMRNIMKSYLGTAETPVPPVGDLSRDLTKSTVIPFAEDDVSEYNMEDGNEADDDSSVVFTSTPRRLVDNDFDEAVILKRPTLVKNERRKAQDGGFGSPSPTREYSSGIASPQNKPMSFKGPKAALRTTPRRVWEDV